MANCSIISLAWWVPSKDLESSQKHRWNRKGVKNRYLHCLQSGTFSETKSSLRGHMIDILVFFQWRGVLIFSYTHDPSEYINRAHSPALMAPRRGHITKLWPIGQKCKWWSKLQILPLKVRTLPSVSISSHGMGCGRGPPWSVETRATP